MDEMLDILTSTATRLFEQVGGDAAARLAREGGMSESLWYAVEEAGLPLALVPEDMGGFGLSPADALSLIRIGGRFGSPVPLAETMIGNWLLASAGAPAAEGIVTFTTMSAGSRITAVDGGWQVEARAAWVPWARHAATIVLIGDDHVLAIPAGHVQISQDAAGNGLPRDDLQIDATFSAEQVLPRPAAITAARVEAVGALARSLEMAGALGTVRDITVQYANERVQFGKPIGKLQAIQQQLAVLAGQAAAASAAVDLAAAAWEDGTSVAVAKARVGEAAGIASGIAHQVLGAIGFTEEHRLHLFTKALWVWRDEFGSEVAWQRRLGENMLKTSAGSFWHGITDQARVGAVA